MPVITALLVVALSVGLSLQLFASVGISTRLTGNQAQQAQQQWALHAALDVAQTRLVANVQNAGVDALDQAWALAADDVSWSEFLDVHTAGPLDSMRISQRITDEQAKLNLNALVSTSPQQGAAPYEEPQMLDAYRRLLLLLSLDPALARTTADLMLRQAQAKLHGEYCCASGRMPIDNFESLQTMPGYTPHVLERLRPYAAVLPTRTTVNVNTTTPQVLAAVVEGLSLEQAMTVLSSRREKHFASLSDFSARLSTSGFTGQIGNTMLGVRSSYYTVLTRVRDGLAERTSRSLLHRISTATIVESTQRIE